MFLRQLFTLSMGAFFSTGLMAEQIIEINSQLPVDGTAETIISGFSFENKRVTYQKVDDLAIFEGDIVLGTEAEALRWNKGSNTAVGPKSIIISGNRFRWIDNLVPFQFSENVTDEVREMVFDAITHWERKHGDEVLLSELITMPLTFQILLTLSVMISRAGHMWDAEVVDKILMSLPNVGLVLQYMNLGMLLAYGTNTPERTAIGLFK